MIRAKAAPGLGVGDGRTEGRTHIWKFTPVSIGAQKGLPGIQSEEVMQKKKTKTKQNTVNAQKSLVLRMDGRINRPTDRHSES